MLHVIIAFQYRKSTTFIDDLPNGYKYGFYSENVSDADSIRTVNLHVYRNRKSKKPAYIMPMELKKFPINLFHVFRKCCMHPYEYKNNLNYGDDYIVAKYTSEMRDGSKIYYNLVEVREVSLELGVPK